VTAPHPDAGRLARLPIPIDPGQYDLQDASGTIRGVPVRWHWTVQGLDDVPGAALVALEAMADVLRSAGGEGDDLWSLADGVQSRLGDLAQEHGPRARLVPTLGEHHPLLIATEECDRLLSAAGRAVVTEVAQRASGTLVDLHRSDGGAPKPSVPSAEVGPRGLAGDRQATRQHHGRPFQAVSLYSDEVIEALAAEGHPITRGAVGENLTLAGLEWATLRPGLRLAVGGQDPVVLEVTSWAPPCRNIAAAFSDRRFDRIDHDKHPGWSRAYAWVIRTGMVQRDDAVTVLP
jgi:MOSC domain-containing protein YiiM